MMPFGTGCKSVFGGCAPAGERFRLGSRRPAIAVTRAASATRPVPSDSLKPKHRQGAALRMRPRSRPAACVCPRGARGRRPRMTRGRCIEGREDPRIAAGRGCGTELHIADRQSVCRIRRARVVRLARVLLRFVRLATFPRRWREVSLVIVDDTEMTLLNAQYLRRSETTDVMSFAYARGPSEARDYDGEIIVNAQRALAEGPRHGGVSRELALYIAHGCDHLAGHDDDTKVKRCRMRRRELHWLRKAADAGLLEGLVH